MSSYTRPEITERTYRDSDGAVIDYGNQWGGQGPAEEAYSVVSHPERFAPLHQVADALIEYLQRDYDVKVTDDSSCVQDLVRPIENPVRAVRLRPEANDAASLTFVLTDFPGVQVHAGLLHDFPFPVCGCDACDDSVTDVAEELERIVQTVVSGGYREQVRGSADQPRIWYQLTAADGSRSGDSLAKADPHLQEASARLASLSGGWAAWPRRK